MKVLLTGAFGNIGHETVKHLLKQGHQVRCLDLDTKANRLKARKFKGKVEIVWADITSRGDVEAALKGQDAVVHLAFILDVMWSEFYPKEARKVNVGGTINVIEAMKAGLSQGRKLVFISSVGVYGKTQHLTPPLKVSDPVNPGTVYAQHKIECEEMVRSSGLDWSTLRLTFSPPIKPGNLDMAYALFAIPLDHRLDFVDPRDVGLAITNSLTSSESGQKTLLIGGGSRNQMLYAEYVKVALGYLGRFPQEAFAPSGSSPPIDWVDATESQRLLNYQNFTLQDYVKAQRAALGPGRYVVPLVAPLVRRWLLQQSPYYRYYKKARGQRAAHQATGRVT
jgi:UDP-glucose 4-epimerase